MIVGLLIVVCSTLAAAAAGTSSATNDPGWMLSFMYNIASFSTAIVPAWLLVRYLRANPTKMEGAGFMRLVRLCVVGETVNMPVPSEVVEAKPETPEPSFFTKALAFLFCVVGLQGSYLVWGVLQEQVMTRSYGTDADGNAVYFKNSQFLVLVNRLLALLVACVIIKCTKQPPHTAPFVKYSFSSMSNVLSSWCQYEALKYVSFPTQVLAKASKIVPVMIMGKFVEGKTYPLYEYVLAALMSLGVAMFLFARAEEDGSATEELGTTTTGGAVLLIGYMVFDSFTSNYQSLLFKEHKMSSYQMMLGINVFSCFFTFWAMLQQGSLLSCITFSLEHPTFMWHNLILSLTSATGQVFIFRTLSLYGTLVFAIVMTTRQVISIFLSAMIFGHEFPAKAWAGLMFTFVAMFAKIYFDVKSKAVPNK